MSETVAVAALAALGPTIIALGGVLGAWLRFRSLDQKRVALAQKEAQERVAETADALNDWARSVMLGAVESERKVYGDTIATLRADIAECSEGRSAERVASEARSAAAEARIDALEKLIEEKNWRNELLTGDVERLRSALVSVPAMVERFTMTIARFSSDATAEQWDEVRQQANAVGVSISTANNIALTRAGQ